MTRSQRMKMIYDYYHGGIDWRYQCTDAYKQVDKAQQWSLCPNCNLIPKVWEFDNGRSTACGCGENQYRHFSIHAESVMSVVRNSATGKSAVDYDSDALRINWNHWVETSEELFPHAQHRTDNRY